MLLVLQVRGDISPESNLQQTNLLQDRFKTGWFQLGGFVAILQSKLPVLPKWNGLRSPSIYTSHISLSLPHCLIWPPGFLQLREGELVTRKELVHLHTKNKTTKNIYQLKTTTTTTTTTECIQCESRKLQPRIWPPSPPKKQKPNETVKWKPFRAIYMKKIYFFSSPFVCLVVLPKIWLASSYVFSGHYLTGTMFIVIVTKPKIKKTKITKI